jgi:DNA-binding protein HU-beta
MNKTELAEAIAAQVDLSKKAAKEAVDAMFDTISKTIADGDPVRITGFGTFKARPRKAKTGFNPATKKQIAIGPRVAPGFRAGTDLKDTVQRKLKAVESGGELLIVKAVK